MDSLDVLFLSYNRWEFTETTLRLLYENTDWSLVRRFVVYDDGSEVETQMKLQRLLVEAPVEAFIHTTHHRSPVGVMRDYLEHEPAEVFAKVDNDVCMPPGWLEHLLSAWTPGVDLLGVELGQPHGLDSVSDEPVQVVPCSHIGGIGLMRTAAFERSPKMKPVGRFGFTEWQHKYRPARGWVFPEIDAPCLDRMPTEPWASLSLEYEQFGWQRPWWKYPIEIASRWAWMEAQCATV